MNNDNVVHGGRNSFRLNLEYAVQNQICVMQDISQYFSIMNRASTANTSIIYHQSSDPLENIAICNDKHHMACDHAKDVINFSTSNYLGLGQNQEVTDAAKQALEEFGTGSNGSPVLSGYYKLHHTLERDLSLLHKYDDTILTSSGFIANLIVLMSLFSKEDTIFLEKHSHGSLIMGAKQSGAKIRFFEENDMDTLEKILKSNTSENKLIVTCGVFSMSGKITNLPHIVKLAKQYKAMVMLDDAHAFGVIGGNGLGTLEYFGINSSDIDILVGTLSKSLSAAGGYICANEQIIRYSTL